jgi:hypothetical protein
VEQCIVAVSAFLDDSSPAVTTINPRRLEGGVKDMAWADMAAVIGV